MASGCDQGVIPSSAIIRYVREPLHEARLSREEAVIGSGTAHRMGQRTTRPKGTDTGNQAAGINTLADGDVIRMHI